MRNLNLQRRYVTSASLLEIIVIGIVVFFVSIGLHYSELLRNEHQTLEDRIKILTNSLNESAQNIADIETEIKKRQELVKSLENNAREAQKLSTLNADQVAAVAQALRGELEKEGRSSFYLSVLTNILSAIFGVVLGEAFRWYRNRRLSPSPSP